MTHQIDIHNYIDLAIGQATAHQVDDLWQAEVPALLGVLAIGSSLNECLSDLKEVIEGWVEVRQQRNQSIPALKFNSSLVALGK